MSSDGARLPGWQGRRAQWQDGTQQVDRADRLACWRQVQAQLDWAERTTLEWSVGRFTGPRAGPPLDLAPDERVLATLPALTLIEAFRAPGKPRAEYTRYSARGTAGLRNRVPVRRAESQRVRGHGPVTITDRRIVFHGPKQRTEWPLEGLTRIEHSSSRPMSMLHVAGRRTVFGLLYRIPDAGHVRLILELAVAHHRGDLARLRAGLAADRHRHELERPGRRPPARPAPQARWRLVRGGLALGAAAAVGMATPHQPGAASAPRLALEHTASATATTTGPAIRSPAARPRSTPQLPTAHRARPTRTTSSGPVTLPKPAGSTRAPAQTAGPPHRTAPGVTTTSTAPSSQQLNSATSGPPVRSPN